MTKLSLSEFKRQLSFARGHLSQARQGLADRERNPRIGPSSGWRDMVRKAEAEHERLMAAYPEHMAEIEEEIAAWERACEIEANGQFGVGA